MATIRLLLDEDVRPLLAEVLRERGCESRHVLELGRGGESDADQLAFAVHESRALLTHNIRDYLLLDRLYRTDRREHCGIILSEQLPFRELLRRTLRFVSRHTNADVRGRIFWLHE